MKKYNDKLHQILQSKQTFLRVHELQTSTINRFSFSQQCKYKALDKEIIIAKLMAEIKCRKIKARKYGWTPELTQAIQTVLYWRGIDKQNKGGTMEKEILKQCSKKAG